VPYPINSLTRVNSSGKDLLAYLYDLSPLDLHLLMILLQAKKPLTLEKLADRIDRDKSTVFRSVQKMAALGLCIKETRSIKEGGYYHVYSAADAGTIKKNTKQRVEEIRTSIDNILKKFDDDLNMMATLDPAKLKAAVEKSLATLVESTKKALMLELKNSGIFDSPCSLREIEDVLRRLVGEGMALKIMENVRAALVLDKA
jgi:predicted transcriptional regulator